MLTAAAGVITAVAGLVVALHQAGLVGPAEKGTLDSSAAEASKAGNHAPPPPAPTKTSEGRYSDAARVPSGVTGAANRPAYSLALPPSTELKFRNHRAEGTYKLIRVMVEHRGSDKLSMKFTIRLTNAGPSDVGFWNDSFRLLLDGVPRAPVSFLNESVNARSAKDADVEFETPVTVRDISLQVLVGDKNETAEIPIVLEKIAK
jgi:hypothetical protein